MNRSDSKPGYERALPEETRRPTASVFDRLIESNVALTASVAKLVRVTHAVIAFNALLVVVVLATLWRHP